MLYLWLGFENPPSRLLSWLATARVGGLPVAGTFLPDGTILLLLLLLENILLVTRPLIRPLILLVPCGGLRFRAAQ